MKQVNIRQELPSEQQEVENLARESFWNVYRPGCLEHYVIHCIRKDDAFIPELNYVMTIRSGNDGIGSDGRCHQAVIIGQSMCMKAEIKMDNGAILPILTLGPICIHPDYKRQGYGKTLLDFVLQRVACMGFGAMCFEGNIDFYGKSGFTFASSFGIRYHGLSDEDDASFFLCKELKPGYLAGVTGEYSTPSGYFVDEAECEVFDRQFPTKQKLRLPGQIF